MTGASARAQVQHQIESAAQTTETQGTGARRIVCLCACVLHCCTGVQRSRWIWSGHWQAIPRQLGGARALGMGVFKHVPAAGEVARRRDGRGRGWTGTWLAGVHEGRRWDENEEGGSRVEEGLLI